VDELDVLLKMMPKRNNMNAAASVLAIVAISLLAPSCDKGEKNNRTHLDHTINQQTFDAYWLELQGALNSGDPSRVATLTSFPVAGFPLEGLGDFSSQEQFQRGFATLFPAEAIRAMLAATVTELRHDENDEWSFIWSNGRDSEGQLSIEYRFAIRGQQYRLTGIYFAG
jgi:hypothetical protein